MTCGIYILLFKGFDKVYVGQSINIEYRYTQHINYLKQGIRENNKLHNAYNKYGAPTYEILCECLPNELNIYEQEAFDIFKSFKHGLNISNTEFGAGLCGAEHHLAKYGEEQYEKAFMLLLNTNYSVEDIAKLVGLTRYVVADISACKSHRNHLKSKFPEEYLKLEATKRVVPTGKFVGIISPKLLAPDGAIHEVGECIRSFCKLWGLDPTNVSRVISGHRKSHKNWVLYKD